MAYNLVVNEPFVIKNATGDKVRYDKGQIVDDAAQVDAILASPQAHHVVKINAPDPVVIPASPITVPSPRAKTPDVGEKS
jgi:hypothetical protein